MSQQHIKVLKKVEMCLFLSVKLDLIRFDGY